MLGLEYALQATTHAYLDCNVRGANFLNNLASGGVDLIHRNVVKRSGIAVLRLPVQDFVGLQERGM